jgi:hypothetical protein
METHEERLLDEREQDLVRTVLVAIVASGVILTVAAALLVRLVAPDWGWSGAWAAGAMAGFWTSVYAGGTAGSGWFQAKEERAHARPAPVAPPVVVVPPAVAGTTTLADVA